MVVYYNRRNGGKKKFGNLPTFFNITNYNRDKGGSLYS